MIETQNKAIAVLEPTRTVTSESWCITRLAMPLILASLLNMGISLTDVVMMSWLGTTAFAAGVAASDYYSIVFYFCAGVVAAISPFVAQALGSGNRPEAADALTHGLLLVVALATPGAFVVWNSPLMLSWIGVAEELLIPA